jgi:hypothetical protein
MGRSNACAPVLLVCAIGGCASGDPGAGGDDRPRLWTLFDLRQALDAGGTVAVTPSRPQGIDPRDILAPVDSGGATLRIIPAYSENQPAAYVMPEVWSGFDEVWVQPWRYELSVWHEASASIVKETLKVGPDGVTGIVVRIPVDRAPLVVVPDKYGKPRQPQLGY